ncbi:MAG: hypothetical protein U0326_39785 [Polyangiales bacterium]
MTHSSSGVARRSAPARGALFALLAVSVSGACAPAFVMPSPHDFSDDASDAAPPSDAAIEAATPPSNDAARPAVMTPDAASAVDVAQPDATRTVDASSPPDATPVADAAVALDAPGMPDIPAIPDAVAAPDVRVTVDVPVIVDAPAVPDVPVIVDVPAVSDVPAAPDVPVIVDVPAVPDVPAAPDVPTAPACSFEGAFSFRSPIGTPLYLRMRADGTWSYGTSLASTSGTSLSGTWMTTGDRIAIRETGTSLTGCSSSTLGTYRTTFSASCNSAVLTLISDSCALRATLMGGQTFTRLAP